MSKNIEKLQLIEESLNQLVKECKEEQFLYGWDSIEARKAKRLEEKLRLIEAEVFFIKTDIATDKPRVDKEIVEYYEKVNKIKTDSIVSLIEENNLIRAENERLIALNKEETVNFLLYAKAMENVKEFAEAFNSSLNENKKEAEGDSVYYSDKYSETLELINNQISKIQSGNSVRLSRAELIQLYMSIKKELNVSHELEDAIKDFN